jgi:8-oxo-dGTP diphosphatase
VDLVGTWTGRHAVALQRALRLSNTDYARHLGVATRTVANWRARPASVLMPETQRILDTALARAPFQAGARFAEALQPRLQAQPLHVAVAVVRKGDDLLMVRRRGDGPLRWQFPSGIVKPGDGARDIAESETLAETGISCVARRQLGSRVHPLTGVLCDYLLCDYLSGVAANLDPAENSAAVWMAGTAVLDALGQQLYQPVADLLRRGDRRGDRPAAGRPPGLGRHGAVPVAAAIIIRGTAVLLVRRRVAEGPLSWQFPAGKVKEGERPERAAVRETAEEVGLKVRAVQVLGSRVHPVTGRMMVYVACQAVSGAARVRDTDELAELLWCPAGEVDGHLRAGVFQPVRDYLAGAARLAS